MSAEIPLTTYFPCKRAVDITSETNTPATTLLTAFPPVEPDSACVLILGSMPGVASLQANAYYAHPRNAFWPIMLSMLGGTATDYSARLDLLKRHGIGLWDVVHQCERPGSLDSNIRQTSVVCNDFAGFSDRHPELKAIVFNGKTAESLFIRHVLGQTGRRKKSGENQALRAQQWFQDKSLQLIALPSSSPAMASLNLEQKTECWTDALKPVLGNRS